MIFPKYLLNWYEQNQRNLPWRKTHNPYKIWLSEIILQQTRVAQGRPYYESFIRTFPTVKDLALAEENQVLKLWQGLGYYSRARNLHATAKTVHFDYDDCFPDTYSELLRLKGVGPYTAAAIASFAFKEKVAVVDGNVYRVLSRFFGIDDDIAASKTRHIFQTLANDLIADCLPDLFNHAIMDFGALQCVPKNPDCLQCIMQENCYAYRYNKVSVLPVKNKKTKIKQRYFQFLIVRDKEGKTIVQQRTQKDIWQGLYQFPLIETDTFIEQKELVSKIAGLFGHEAKSLELMNQNDIRHKLSHQELHIRFYEVAIDTALENALDWEKAMKLAYPVVVWNFIQRINVTEL